MDDGSDRVVMSYLSQAPVFQGERRWEDPGAAPGNPRIRLGGLRITDGGGRVSASLDVESLFSIAMDYELLADMPPMRIVYLVSNSEGLDLFTTADTAEPRWAERPRPRGAYTSTCAIPGGLLKPGRYSVRVSAEIPFVEMLFLVEDAIGFEVLHSGSANTRYPETWAGVISPRIDWTVSNHEV
jgi:hypothetical protein